jgi:hypothetical protein
MVTLDNTHHSESPLAAVPGLIEVEFPDIDDTLSQDKEFCTVTMDGISKVVRFHDYHEIYAIPGLYERIFYQELECCSPKVVCNLLKDELENDGILPAELKVFEIGAGNGMVAEELNRMGVTQIVGSDIIMEAKIAAFRDRPDVYTDYFTVDLTDIPADVNDQILKFPYNAMVSVAALGFDDIPPQAYAAGFNLVKNGGWIAFNIKNDFVNENADGIGFKRLLQRMQQEGIFEVCAKKEYQHRLSISQDPLPYFAFVGRKRKDIPESLIIEASQKHPS